MMSLSFDLPEVDDGSAKGLGVDRAQATGARPDRRMVMKKQSGWLMPAECR